MKDYQIQATKKNYPKGTRVELDNMSGEPQMPQGLKGTVKFVDDIGQIHVAWNNGSSLALVPGEDSFHKIEPELNRKVLFYKYSLETAKSDGQTDLWRESHRENRACKAYIDSHETGLSATAYKDNIVDKDGSYAQGIIEKFGYQRCMHVVACTINTMDYDGRFSQDNKDWAESKVGWLDKNQNREYVLNTHPCLVDVLARGIRQEYDKLGLYTAEHCEQDSSNLDYTDHVIVVRAECLPEKYWQPENQIFYATTGFGCSPTASGRKVYGQYLSDGEQTNRNRAEFIGVMKDEYIPDWAREKLMELSQPEPEQAPENPEGMEMNM